MTTNGTAREYWIGSVFVVEWDLVDLDGAPVEDATVTGFVSKPSGELVAMELAHSSGSATYRLSHRPTAAGSYGWRVTAEGSGQGAIAGNFTVNRETTGAPPIELDPVTDLGMIRLLITDVDEAFPLFTDAQLEAFLAREGGVKRAAALALETLSTSETLIAKKITTQDLSTDGPAVAKDLRDRAKGLREQAKAEADGTDGDAFAYGFDFVDYDRHAGWRRF